MPNSQVVAQAEWTGVAVNLMIGLLNHVAIRHEVLADLIYTCWNYSFTARIGACTAEDDVCYGRPELSFQL
jgi:hypothetical protein